MSGRLRLTLLAAGTFIAALLGAAIVVDVATSDARVAVLPGVAGDPVALLSGVPKSGRAPMEEVLATEPYRKVEVDAEYAAIVVPGEADPRFRGSAADPPFGPESGVADDAIGGEIPSPDREDPGFDEDRRVDIATLDLLSPDLIFRFIRFLDPCAAVPGDPGCPPGTGGTILEPLDGGTLDLAGPFDLSRDLYPLPRDFSRCPDTGRLRSNEYAFMLLATHPARIDITYHRTDDVLGSAHATADVTDPSHREFTRFVESLESRGGPVGGTDRVQHCFVIDGGRAEGVVVIEAAATSFTGETDSETYSLAVSERRNRPPITVAPLNGYEANIAVPVQGDGRHTTIVRAIRSDMGLTCRDIEPDVLAGGQRDVVIAPDSPPQFLRPSRWIGRDPMGAIVESPDWRYDSTYDRYDFWNLQFQEGSGYALCVWWLRSPERSFDSATVVDRETRWLSTPNALRSRISITAVRAPSTRSIAADSIRLMAVPFTLYADCTGSPGVRIPALGLDRDDVETYGSAGGVTLCDYNGYNQPEITPIYVWKPDGVAEEFAIPTPTRGGTWPRSDLITIDLSDVRGSGLCGTSFGSCDPPTHEYPVARIVLTVDTYAVGSSSRDDWGIGGPFAFEAAPAEPDVLPERVRIDRSRSGVEAEGRHALRVTAGFDRPVTLTAALEGDPASYCLEGEPPSFATDRPALEHSFTLGGLCTHTMYAVELTVTDAEGRTTRVRSGPGPEGWDADWLLWPGTSSTAGYEARYFVSSVAGLTDTLRTDQFFVGVDRDRVDLVSSTHCLTSRRNTEVTAVWGETVDVDVMVRLSSTRRDASGDCPHLRRTVRWEASVEATFTIDEFLAGSIVVPVPLTDPDTGAVLPDSLQVRISGTAR